MTNVFIFHGTGGHPTENWFPWIKEKLESRNYNVIIPQFPTPQNQTPETWFAVFEKYKEMYTPDSILIGHSLGGAFMLRVLESYDVTVRAAYSVAASIGVLPIKYYEGDKPFIGHPFDWERIRNHARKWTIYHSDNDPFVCLGNGEELAKRVGVKLSFIQNAGHFNAAAGYTHFEALYQKIVKDLE